MSSTSRRREQESEGGGGEQLSASGVSRVAAAGCFCSGRGAGMIASLVKVAPL